MVVNWMLVARVQADDENDARSQFADLVPFLLVNDLDEAEGVSIVLQSAVDAPPPPPSDLGSDIIAGKRRTQ